MRMMQDPPSIRYYVLDKQTRAVRELDDDGCGDPLIVQWARQLTAETRRIAWDDVPDMRAHVSTIFVGFDMLHDFGMHRQPMLFETAVLYDDNAGDTSHVVAATLDDAEAMHARQLQRLRNGERI